MGFLFRQRELCGWRTRLERFVIVRLVTDRKKIAASHVCCTEFLRQCMQGQTCFGQKAGRHNGCTRFSPVKLINVRTTALSVCPSLSFLSSQISFSSPLLLSTPPRKHVPATPSPEADKGTVQDLRQRLGSGHGRSHCVFAH